MTSSKPAKARKCKCGCNQTFTPRNSFQVAATPECALNMVRKQREKSERAASSARRRLDRETRDRLKTRSDWQREAQAAVNSYVRERDSDMPCISCGRLHRGQWHAGHYLSRGAHPELALEPRNIHRQCAPCNTHLSGNQALYRRGLIERLGIDVVEWLEGPHEPTRHSIDDLRSIRDDFRERLRELKKNKLRGSLSAP